MNCYSQLYITTFSDVSWHMRILKVSKITSGSTLDGLNYKIKIKPIMDYCYHIQSCWISVVLDIIQESHQINQHFDSDPNSSSIRTLPCVAIVFLSTIPICIRQRFQSLHLFLKSHLYWIYKFYLQLPSKNMTPYCVC